MNYDFLIVGAGLFGSVFARKLSDKGKKCLVIEKRSFVGGNCYTERDGEIIVHKYGAHIFHTSDVEIWNYVNKFAKFLPFINSPLANYNGKIYNLPFNMNTFYQLWGVVTPDEAKAKIQSQRIACKSPKNVEEQALSLVGEDVYKTLIKGYTEKQWGRSATDLPAFIIKRLPVRFTYDNNYFNDLYQGIPEEGYTKLVENLLSGIEVRLNTSYSDFLNGNDTATKVLYTGAIDEFFNYLYGKLEYRTLRFESERLQTDNFQGNAVVNYTSENVPYTRIIEHKHFLKTDCPYTVITREYPCAFKSGDEPYYPVNDEKNNALYQKYAELAEGSGVIFGGRLGQYKYFDMDKTVRAALDLAEKF